MMTAETKISKPCVEIQGDHDLSPQLPPVPDCNVNGINHHDEDNVVARDDSEAEDSSYVFVSGNNDLVVPIDNDDPKENAAQVSDHSVGLEAENVKFPNSSASGAVSSWVFEVAASSNNSSEDKNDDVTQVLITDDSVAQQGVRVGSLDTMHPELDHEKDPISSLQDEENQEAQVEVGVLELDVVSANNVQPEISLDIVQSIDANEESQGKYGFELTIGLGEGEKPQRANLEATCCKSSQVGILGTVADSVGKPEPQTAFDVVESTDVNKKHPEENSESTDESGERGELDNAGLEVANRESSEVEISKHSDFQQNSESTEESTDTKDTQIMMQSDSSIHASPRSEVQEANTEEQSNTDSTGIVPVSIPEQPEYHDDNLDNVREKFEEETKILLPSDVKDNEETVNVSSENTIIPVPVPEQSETHHDDNLGNNGEKLGEETKMQLSGDAKEIEETITVFTENGIIPAPISEHSESHHDDNLGNDGEKLEEETETPLSLDAEENLETITVLADTGTVPITIPELSESDLDDNCGNAGVKLEEETNPQLSSDAKENQATITVLGENGNVPVTISEQSESHHDDNLGNAGVKLEEEIKTQIPSDAKQNQETITLLGEIGKIPVSIAEPSESHLDVNLANWEKHEEETETPLSLDAEENLETITVLADTGTVPITIPELSESDLDDNRGNAGVELEEETNPQLSSDAKENQATITVFGENGNIPVTISEQSESHHDDNLGNAGVKLEEEIKTQIPSDAKQNQETITLLGEIGKIPVTIAEPSESHLDINLANDGEKLEEETSTHLSSDAKETQEIIPVVGENGDFVVDLEQKFKKSVNEVELPSGTETTCGPILAEIECPVSSFNDSVPETKASFEHIDTSERTPELQESSESNDNLIPDADTDIGQSPVGNDENVHLKPEVSVVDAKSADLQPLQFEAEKEFEVGSSCNDVSNISITTNKLPILENLNTESMDGHLSGEHLIVDDKFTRQETKDVGISVRNPNLMSLTENSGAGAVAGQDVAVEPLTRPFHFLIRMPRFEDFKMKEQIVKAQLLVEEKTQHRDAFRIEVQKYKANCLGYAADYDAANSESRALKRSVKAKRAEIDSLQSVINKAKNAISVEDIDTRIHSMEHMIEHETLPLKEEKLLIREIKQLKQLREQLSSNLGSQDEVQQALNDRDQIEERLKVLKKELDTLKESVLKADALVRALEKKYGDENKKVKEIQNQYSVANNVRQDAYAHLQSLRKQLYEKNQQFRMYKEDAAAASNYAMKRDRDALHHLCINQVERVMELWNKNDEFREDYVRCNMKGTVRRLGTLDGRSLGPDEQPPVLTSLSDGRVNRVVSNPANSGHLLQTSQNLEQEVVKPREGVSVGDKTKVNELEEKKLTTRPEKQEKPVLENGLASVSVREISDEIREEKRVLTAEELELARKEEELKKVEAAAKLKEQRRLEEKTKALEALERKKRNAEKAQLRAELRAQKEAEQREKEREKRMRKKERKKVPATEVPDGNSVVETTSSSESVSETTKEGEIKENAAATSKRSQKPSQFTKQSKTKSIPPPLRNRSRRKLQQWMWIVLTCLVVVALFFVGNLGLFSNLSSLRRRNYGF